MELYRYILASVPTTKSLYIYLFSTNISVKFFNSSKGISPSILAGIKSTILNWLLDLTHSSPFL